MINMGFYGRQYLLAILVVVLIVSLFAGSLDPAPRSQIALSAIAVSSLAAAGIIAGLTMERRTEKQQLAINLLFSACFFMAGIEGYVWQPNDSLWAFIGPSILVVGGFALAVLGISRYSRNRQP